MDADLLPCKIISLDIRHHHRQATAQRQQIGAVGEVAAFAGFDGPVLDDSIALVPHDSRGDRAHIAAIGVVRVVPACNVTCDVRGMRAADGRSQRAAGLHGRRGACGEREGAGDEEDS
jgi:hypothetical protein